MSVRKWLAGTGAALTLMGMSTSVAWAQGGQSAAHQNQEIVALGDSISYGYNLGVNNEHPSKYAFPYLIGQKTGDRVHDLAVPGATSEDLLNALQTSARFDENVKHASVITIDIGSNDLLGVAVKDGLLPPGGTPSPTSLTDLSNAVAQFAVNLPAILQDVRQLNPNAQILLYNLYDPITATESTTLYQAAEYFLGLENDVINAVNLPDVTVVDAYGAFAGHQLTDVLPLDVHPTIAGQQLLASIGYQALQSIPTPP